MTNQRREKIHHYPRDPGHLHQQAEDDKHRHREQQQVGNAVVDPVDDDRQRQVGSQRQIGEGRKTANNEVKSFTQCVMHW